MQDMNKSKTKDKNPTTKEISYRISEKGKSRSYEYEKLYPVRYTGHQIRGTSTGYWRTTEWGELAADIGNRKGCAADERMGWQDWR